MVARDPDDRPDLQALAPPVLKGLQRLRGARPPQMADDMGVSIRAFEHFENGKGRLNVERIHRFAALLNVDPFAILAGFEIRSPDFALRCADNKLMMIFMLALEDFEANAQEAIVHLDPLTLMESFKGLFDELTTKARAQQNLVAQWKADNTARNDADAPDADPEPEPPKEDPEPEPE